MKKHYWIIWNQASGIHDQKQTEIGQAITDLTDQHNCQIFSIEEILEVNLSLVSKAPDKLLAVGGDGTVSAAAGIAIELNCPLVIIPTGTFNHLAVHLNIPREIKPALALLDNGQTINIDVGHCNGRVFVNFISLGFYAEVISLRSNYQRLGDSKWVGFLKSLWQESTIDRRLTVEFSSQEGTAVRRETPLLFIGNGQFSFGSFDFLASRHDLQSQRLHLVMLRNYGRVRLLLYGLAAMFVDISRWVSVKTLSLGSIRIKLPSGRQVPLVIDGELQKVEGTLKINSLAKALAVVVPNETKV